MDSASTEGASLERKASELWLDLDMFNRQPMKQNLPGLALEYALRQLYSRDAGQRGAKLSFDVGQGTQDLGYRNDVAMGENGSELKLSRPGMVRVTATVAALLNEKPNPGLQNRRYDQNLIGTSSAHKWAMPYPEARRMTTEHPCACPAGRFRL